MPLVAAHAVNMRNSSLKRDEINKDVLKRGHELVPVKVGIFERSFLYPRALEYKSTSDVTNLIDS